MNPAGLRLLFGTDEPVAPALELRSGRLQTHLRGTRLGPVTCDGHEVWHGIDFLHRDADWGTPAPQVEHLEHSASASGFRAHLRGRIAAAAEIAFEIHIEADEGRLRYEVSAVADADLATNRTGVVLLHPLAACGRRVEVEHTDGRSSLSTFPTLIAPWPPFMLVRAIRHEYADGAWAACRFAGDEFELEDQRNNADASFKTYSRSNLMPRPYVLRAGAMLRQSVDLRIEACPAAPHAVAGRPVQVRIGDVAGNLPAVGTAIGTADLRGSPNLSTALRQLAPAHLHLCAEASEPVDAAGLGRLLAEAPGCALHLEITGLRAGQAAVQLASIAGPLHAAGLAPAAIAVFPSVPPILEAARRAFPHARIGGGTPFFFTQLNRIEDVGSCDFLCFGTSAVVHGADDEEIMAGLHSLPSMIATLRHRHGGVPVHVGPSSIGARRSPLGRQPESDGTRRLALARRDPRTRGLYGAAWALGYVAQLVQTGVQAITLFDLAGDAALAGDRGTTPAFELLRQLAQPARWRRVEVSDPASVAALALQAGGRDRTLLANLRADMIEVQLNGGARLPLGPYAIAAV